MNTTVKKIDSSIPLWSMLGPLFIILTMFVVVMRSSPGQWGFPLAALCGVLMCYQWKWKGFAVACVTLVGVAVYQVVALHSDDLIWTSLLTLSILTSFLVTILFLDESHGALDVLLGQSASYTESLSQLEEKLAASQYRLETERQVLTSRIEPLKQELAEREEKIRSSEKLVAIVREELMSAHTRQEKFLQELFDSKQHSATLEQQVERLQYQLTYDHQAVNEKVLSQYNETLASRDGEIIDLKARLETSLEEERIARLQSESYLMELIDLREQQQLDSHASNTAQEDKLAQQSIIDELNEHVDSLESTLVSLQKEMDSITHQSHEASQIGEIHLATIKSLKTSIDAREEELKIVKGKYEEQQRNSGYREKALQLQIEDYVKKLSSSTQQLEHSQRKLLELSNLNEKLALLQSQLQEHISEKRRLLLDLENTRQALSLSENTKSLSEERIHVLSSQLADLQTNYEKANEEIVANQHLSTVCHDLTQKLADLELNLAKHHDKANEELVANKHLSTVCNDLTQKLADLESNLAKHHKDKELLLEQLQTLRNQNEQLTNTLIDAPQDIEKSREIRRLEGLYQQLRTQFSDKSKILDDTRRNLFHTQEELSALQKDLKEIELYGNCDTDEFCYSLLASIERELTSQLNDQQHEISELNSLIEVLISPQERKSTGHQIHNNQLT